MTELQKARKATQRFRLSYEKKEYSAIYQQADARLRQSITEPNFVTAVENINQRLGKPVVVNEAGGTSWLQNQQQEVLLKYNTTFEKGRASEEFVWLIEAHSSRLISYKVTSPNLP